MANGGIIGPVVTPPNVQTQSAPGVWTLQEAQEYIRQGLWPRRYDPLYNYTTLLLSGNGANNATNSSFLDSSSNNFTVTRNGNATQGTFSPFSQTGWGNYFDGTGDYLSVADNSVLRLGTSNFTIECWVNRAVNGTAHSILAKGGASTGWLLEVTSGNVLQFTHTTTTITTSLPVYAGNWVHVAAVREGTGSNQFKLYINGTLAQTATMATDFTQTDTLYIGANRSAATTMNGYISNVRIVNGTALYTAQFTPSTTPLTTTSQGATAAQVELLTCQSNRFLDNSGNGFTVTRNGDASVVAFSPFNATRPWDPLTYGGGGYFDGTGDYLSTSNVSALRLGSSDFTIEFWANTTSFGAQLYTPIVGIWDANVPTSTIASYYVGINAYNTTYKLGFSYFSTGGVQTDVAFGTATNSTGTWDHYAVVRSGNLLYGFKNGTLLNSGGTAITATIADGASTDLRIGGIKNGNVYNGYISNLRIVKGTAVYTTNFTVPTEPLTAITNTSLLLNFTNIGITDATSKNALETVGDAKISTAQSKFGGSSMYFDGTGDYLKEPLTDLLKIGSGDYTFECWLYRNNSDDAAIYTNRSTTYDGFVFGIRTNKVFMLVSQNGSTWAIDTYATTLGNSVPTTTWSHIAISRQGSSWRVFIDGTLSYTSTLSGSVFQNQPFVYIGYDSGVTALNGYIQDLRITKGVARYTENFAVPDSAFATLGNTPPSVDPYFDYTTLLLPGSGSNNATNNSFLDSSANNFTITRNGNTTQGTFSPFSQTGWGNYFNGSSTLSVGTSLFNYTTGNASTTTFTIEAFVYLNSYQSSGDIFRNPCIIGKGDIYLNFGVNGSGNLFFYHYDGSVRSVTGSSVIPLFTWTYVAVRVTGGTATLYVNGTSNGSGTWYGIASAGLNTPSLIGISSSSGAALYLNGYISNLRVSTVARTITTPTTAYTNDANTALLTAQSNRFVDNSSSPITLTANGSPRVVAFSPFNPSASWSAATYGGSGYFDGNGDYLTAPSNAAFAVGSVFTIEFWLYPISAGANPVYIYLNETTGSLQFGLNSGNLAVAAAGIAWRLTGSKGPVTNAWNHCVLVRSGTGTNQTSIFLNGERIANGTVTDAWTTDVQAIIQSTQGSSYQTNGYMSGVRIVKGTAVYDPTLTSLTVPTAPLTAITNTSLLLNFTNAGIYDATSKNDLETVADAKISTAQSVWTAYGSSMSFDGTGDWLTVIDQPVLRFGTGNFTIEMWLYLNATGAARGLVGKGDASNGWLVSLNSSNNVVFTYGTSTITSTGTISASVWTNITVVREGTSTNQTKIYINGTNDGTGTVSTDFTQTNTMYVGANRTGGDALNGYLQDLRITRWARYTSNFQPPSAPLALR